MDIQVKFIEEYVGVYKNYKDHMDIIETSVEPLIKETEKKWLRENAVLGIKPEEALTWYRHNKPMRGGDGAGLGAVAVAGDNGADDGENSLAASNYPSADMNNIPVGDVKGDVAGSEYQDAENGAKFMEEANAGGATEFQGSVAEYALAHPNAVQSGGGGEAALVMTSTIQPAAVSSSLLEPSPPTEITIDTKTLPEGDSNTKKIITMTQ